jgi:nitroimidazol reductase NimA-like FMN-containing flavoprotein (pyridoxamine 5'-phosphate oxidase superfamily)
MGHRDDAPAFTVLPREECECLLARNRVGRVAFARGGRVEIVPLHYVFADGVLCGRTARGTRLDEAAENFSNAWPAAFEVEEVDDVFDWRSAVVHGNLHAAVKGGPEWRRDQPRWEKALRAFRRVFPEAFTDADPAAFRDVILRIDVAEISGRQARSAPPRPTRRAARPPACGLSRPEAARSS